MLCTGVGGVACDFGVLVQYLLSEGLNAPYIADAGRRHALAQQSQSRALAT